MGIRTTPGSLEDAIAALEQDHAFLLRGDVFTEDLVETWITYKREKELDPIRCGRIRRVTVLRQLSPLHNRR